jgi:hypothetical protein
VTIDSGFSTEVSENDATLFPPLLLVSLPHSCQRLKAVMFIVSFGRMVPQGHRENIWATGRKMPSNI